MRPVHFIIVDDKEEFADALSAALKTCQFPVATTWLNPNRDTPPTFEEFVHEIESVENGWWNTVVLMDNHLGRWKWSGAHMAPSFWRLINISSDRNAIPGAKFHFTRKSDITLRKEEDALRELRETATEAVRKFMPPDWLREAGLAEATT